MFVAALLEAAMFVLVLVGFGAIVVLAEAIGHLLKSRSEDWRKALPPYDTWRL